MKIPHEFLAETAHMRSRVLRLVDVSDVSEGGSAVKVRIGGRYFLVTAAHVMVPGHQISALVPGENSRLIPLGAATADDDLDLAIVEVSEELALPMEGDFATIDEIDGGMLSGPNEPVCLVGFPGQLIDTPKLDGVQFAICNSLTYPTVTILTPSHTPTQLLRPINEHQDFFLSFEPDEKLLFGNVLAIEQPQQTVNLAEQLRLPGMSGGGVWKQGSAATQKIWVPSLLLIGIQTSCYAEAGWARATNARCLLNMFRQRFPELGV